MTLPYFSLSRIFYRMEILIESSVTDRESLFEIYGDATMLGHIRIVQTESLQFEYELVCSEAWVESYLLAHLCSL